MLNKTTKKRPRRISQLQYTKLFTADITQSLSTKVIQYPEDIYFNAQQN